MNVIDQIKRYCTTHFYEIGRFVVVGFAIFVVNFGSFSALHYKLHLDYRIAASAAYVIAVICHFTANKLFTFSASGQQLTQNLPRYGVMLTFNYVVTLVAFWLTVRLIGAPPHYGVVVASAGTAFSSFFIMKYFVFHAPTARAGIVREASAA